MNLFIYHEDTQVGPLSESEVHYGLACGKFLRSDLAWHEGLSGWIPLNSVAGFALNPLPPPLPPRRGASGVSEDIAAIIRAKANADFPGDYSTQRYSITSETEAYIAIQQLSFRDIPANVFADIREAAARDFPDDYSTQLYEIQSQTQAYREINTL